MIEVRVRVKLGASELNTSQTPAVSLEDHLSRLCSSAFLNAAEQTEHLHGPPRKRRRIAKSENPSEIPDQSTEYVVLADTSLIFDLGKPQNKNPQALIEQVVDITQFSKSKEDHAVQFVLSGLTLSLDAINTEEHVEKLLSWASLLTTQHKKFAQIAICECRLLPPALRTQSFQLRITIKWKIGVSAVAQKAVVLTSLLHNYLPGPNVKSTLWSPQDFYENVHVPERKEVPSIDGSAIGLATQLYPFQDRAVRWLLGREGVRYNVDGNLEPILEITPPLSFIPATDAAGQACHVSHLSGQVALDVHNFEDRINGGILAEEMGLGKTVELIALILLHKRQVSTSSTIVDPYTNNVVTPSSATLIITPSSILEQWMSELRTHAPTLKVTYYEGVKNSELSDEKLKDMLLEQDVVLTTYGVLANEIHYADQKPDRNLRQAKKYEPRRTPLVQISWWRVCLDEAQMIESGVSNAAQVARLIPRQNAWAVSGTPLKKEVKDLLGLLVFLRYAPFCYGEIWTRLVKYNKDVFARLFRHIALRHTKGSVSDELHIPPQKRLVISVPFTAIEEQNYSQLFQQMCDDCGLNVDGAPCRGDWDPTSPSTVEKMRSWLTRLRQTCLHAEIGVRNRRALGRGNGPLRTIEEVLEVLIDQNETSLRVEERAVLSSKITQGHVLSFGKDRKRALEVYQEALKDTTAIVNECRGQLAKEQQKAEQIRATLRSDDTHDGEHEELEEEDDNVEETTGRLNVARQRLRAALEMKHVSSFFSATAYFQLKESLSSTDTDAERVQGLEEQESQAYAQAKAIRKELLAEVSEKTTHLITRVATLKAKSFAIVPLVEIDEQIRGIESRKIFDAIEDLADILNDHAGALREVRAKLVDLLTVRLLDQDEEMEMTGDEYEISTKQQDEQYALHEALRAAHADRHGMITGQVNLLVNNEMSNALKQAMNGARDDPDNKGPAPEIMISMLGRRERMLQALKALSKRNNLPPNTQISIRGIIADARSMLTALQWQEGGRSNRAAVEASILERELEKLQSMASQQMKALTSLEKEIDLYRSTMNQRLEFYRQLQHISDTVAPLQEEETEQIDKKRLEFEQRKEAAHNEKLATFKTKRRYLNHLRTVSSGTDEQRICVICQSTFEIGVLTVCGHQYCKECIGLWWNVKGTCPTCKRHLKQRDFHEITYKPQALRLMDEEHSNPPNDHSSQSSPPSNRTSSATTPKTSIYTSISPATLSAIKSIDLRNNTSYGTKIDTIARHLLYLRASDPGSKSIIFSQYRDFLHVLGSAFDAFRIGHTSIAAKNGTARFREDASVECFLMHAKADSSGLNLVNATHVFLCEPLINAALELQAIARVHRIGQRRQTTVWMYLISDTVEQAIYDISVSRRLAHMQKRKTKPKPTASATTSTSISRATTPGAVEEKTLDAANSLELQKAPMSKLLSSGQSGGEVVEANDLWNCLFGSANAAAGRARGRSGLSTAMAVVGAGVSEDADREVGRFLRADAADRRVGGAGQSGAR